MKPNPLAILRMPRQRGSHRPTCVETLAPVCIPATPAFNQRVVDWMSA